ncbi:cytochrome d ubiquinol oxidase subunit II [Vibrio lentus]|nr:cytochrome d ubiquinol oxidase subunit II [Vibrio lentus]
MITKAYDLRWVLIGVHWLVSAVTDGFDMGCFFAALSPVIGKSDTERRIMLNTIAPHWDGNQVWLITAGGALLQLHGHRFTRGHLLCFYFANVCDVSCALVTPLALDYRSKIEDPKWRKTWDYALCFSGTVPSDHFRCGIW